MRRGRGAPVHLVDVASTTGDDDDDPASGHVDHHDEPSGAAAPAEPRGAGTLRTRAG
jgi:hypothetical protein